MNRSRFTVFVLRKIAPLNCTKLRRFPHGLSLRVGAIAPKATRMLLTSKQPRREEPDKTALKLRVRMKPPSHRDRYPSAHLAARWRKHEQILPRL